MLTLYTLIKVTLKMSSSSGRNQSTTSSLLPYLTIHMQSIGLTVEEIAIIYLALPFTTFLSPPITDMIVTDGHDIRWLKICRFSVSEYWRRMYIVTKHLSFGECYEYIMQPSKYGTFNRQKPEIPGVVPSAFVMRHPDSGDIEKPLGSCEITPYLKKFKMEWMPSVIYGRNNISLPAVLSASLDPTNPVAIVKPSSSSKTNFKCLRSETRVQRMLKQSEHANG
uniref:Major facilitator superfamily associated domain-containing protein n=1 Tax=Glossina palpalis gambiensis TaxID=67801 RepID=A0A1B0AT42_9MUSC